MPFNVQEFKSAVDGNGLMRNNKFMVNFPLPAKLSSIMTGVNSNQLLSMYCKAAPLPGIGILTQDVYRYGYGPIERKPYGTVVNDIMLHFYVDGNNVIRQWLRSWVRSIINPDTSKGINSTYATTGQSAYEIGYKSDYAVDVNIVAFDSQGLPKISIVLIEAYPNYIGDVHQDWEDKNTTMMLPISLTFRDWYEDSLQDSGAPSITSFSQSLGLDSSGDIPLGTIATAPATIGASLTPFSPTITNFFNPNVDLDTSGVMPIGVQTPYGIRY